MARKNTLTHNKTFVPSLLTSMSLNGILQLILVVSALAERCTRAVPVQKYPAKKMHVLRRVPASCSNWDKAWSWITNVDCGTKYRLDYITVPPREVVQYKLEYVCCDGDTDCDESEDVHSSTFDSTDEKFLAIILGSTAAAVIIIIIVVAISLCTRRRRCASSGRERGHAYDRAEAEDYQKGDTTVEKLCRAEDATSDGECKPGEPVYAEIGEETLPRYTDLFNDENNGGAADPFIHASAPVYYSGAAKENARGERRNNTSSSNNTAEKKKHQAAQHYTNTANVTPLQSKPPSSYTIQEEVSYAVVSKQTRANPDNSVQVKSGATAAAASAAVPCGMTDSSDTKYYNVGEKKKKKKKKNSQMAKDRENRRRSKSSMCSGAGVEMIVKSTSASETVGSNRRTNLPADAETVLSKQQKRRSAPPDSIDVGINSVHPYSLDVQQCAVTSSTSSSSTGKDKNITHSNNTCDVISVCTIHEKPCPSPLSPHQGISPSQSTIHPSPSDERHVLRKSPSAGHGGTVQLRIPSDCSHVKPRHKSDSSSYENMPRSNSQPNAILPHVTSNSASLERIHHQIPTSRSMQTQSSISSRDKNNGNKSKSKEGRTSKSSQKRSSNSSLRAKDGVNYELKNSSDVSSHKDGRVPRAHSSTSHISNTAIEFQPSLKSNDHNNKTALPTSHNNGEISAPRSTSSSSATREDDRNQEVTSQTYDSLQYPRDSSPDRVYQKLSLENNVHGEDRNSWKV